MKHPLTISDYCSDWFMKGKVVHAKSTPGPRTREEVIASYRGLAAEFIEINHFYWEDVDPDVIRGMCEAAGFRVYSYNFFLNLALPDGERAAAVGECAALLERTKRLGARHGMIVPALLKPDVALEQQRDWVIDGLRECAGIARSMDMLLTSENCDYPPIRPLMGSGMDCAAICKAVDSPDFRLIYDCCAPLFVEEDTFETLHAMLPHMEHVHLKNSRPLKPGEQTERYLDSDGGTRFTGTLLAEGSIDIPRVVRELRQAGYDKTLSVEYQGIADPVADLATNIDYVRMLEHD